MQSGTSLTGRVFPNFTLPLSPVETDSSDSYLRQKIALSVVGIGITAAFLIVVAFTGLKEPFVLLASVSRNVYVGFLIFAIALEIFLALVKFPLDYYAGFVIEHRYNLSSETFPKWFIRKAKGALVGGTIGVILLTAFYFLLAGFPRAWWIMFAAFFFVVQVLVARLFPTVILPLFYKLKPLSNDSLAGKIAGLVGRFGYRMSGVFSFDLSRETRKANAALTGLGKSRKIIISDTLLENFTEGEIEVVLAHELGHLVKRHMVKGILFGGVVSLAGIFLAATMYNRYTAALRLPLTDLRAIPFLALLLTLFGVIAMPLGNFFSRKIEHEADIFALRTTGMKAEFAESMRKLGKLNLVPENPPAWIEKIFFSHPSIGARIKTAEDFK